MMKLEADEEFLDRAMNEIGGTVAMLLQECRSNPEARALAIASELQRQALVVLKAVYGGNEVQAKTHMLMAVPR